MSYQSAVLKIMISSPSDVIEERQIIHQYIHNWNASHSESEKITLLPIDWKNNSIPEMGSHPQEIINKQLVTTSDLLIAVFWHRIGSPTLKADSGTIEEINEFISTNKPVMMYFSLKPVPMSHDKEQLSKVLDFKKSCKTSGLFSEYYSNDEFRELFAQHLRSKVVELKKYVTIPSQEYKLSSLSVDILKLAIESDSIIAQRVNKNIQIGGKYINRDRKVSKIELVVAIDELVKYLLISKIETKPRSQYDTTSEYDKAQKYYVTADGLDYVKRLMKNQNSCNLFSSPRNLPSSPSPRPE